MTYKVPRHIDPNKIFLVNRSEIQGRLEAEFYKPSIAILESKIRDLSTKKLSDYVITMAGGATPKTDKEDYYSDENNGITFLRVQNLQPTGEITKENCKFISKKIHNGLLKRSQVVGGDLLIKITGVGRMAVASVAPEGFIGNIKQHMVLVKTQSKTISHYLARYLNLDIIEKIASRHTTGGTRPALDYSALRSIPIIDGINFNIIDNAIEIAKQKNKDAQDLLYSIDDYILDELGITLPQQNKVDTKHIPIWMNTENPLVKNGRLFMTRFKEIEGGRFDSSFIGNTTFIKEQIPKYPFVQLKDLLKKSPQYGANEEAIDGNPQKDVRYIRITDIDELGNLKLATWKTANNIDVKYLLSRNDILFARSGSVGKCYIHKTENPAIFAGYLIRINVNERVNPDFLFYYCCSKFYYYWVNMIQRPAVQANINSEEYKSLLIPLPPMDIQNRIVSEISEIRYSAKSLQIEAQHILESAKSKVEKLILGE